MKNKDILLNIGDGVFSYRVAGIIIEDGKVLLQRPLGENYYAVPGGHVSFNESAAEAVVREFEEETSLRVKVDRLILVGENFFPWGEKKCHQVGFYYLLKSQEKIEIKNFLATDELEREPIKLEFLWVDIENLKREEVYPPQVVDVIKNLDQGIKDFVFREDE